jgi:hypothetical protein
MGVELELRIRCEPDRHRRTNGMRVEPDRRMSNYVGSPLEMTERAEWELSGGWIASPNANME